LGIALAAAEALVIADITILAAIPPSDASIIDDV